MSHQTDKSNKKQHPHPIKTVHRVHNITTRDSGKCTKWNITPKPCFYIDSQQGAALTFSQRYMPTKPCAEKMSPFLTARESENSSEISGSTIPASVNSSWPFHNLSTCQKVLLVLLGPNWTAKSIVRYVLGENFSLFMKERSGFVSGHGEPVTLRESKRTLFQRCLVGLRSKQAQMSFYTEKICTSLYLFFILVSAMMLL